MKITFLGVDGCIPAPGSDTASFLFERGLMIDVGWHATETLRRCGKTPADVRSVLFTHCHHDHLIHFLSFPAFRNFFVIPLFPFSFHAAGGIDAFSPLNIISDNVDYTLYF